MIAAGTMVIVASMRWLHFDRPQHHLLSGIGASLRWGYGHYLVFASAAAAVTTVPIAVFITMFWLLALRPERDGMLDAIALGGAVLMLASTFLPQALPIAAGMLALTVLAVSLRRRATDTVS